MLHEFFKWRGNPKNLRLLVVCNVQLFKGLLVSYLAVSYPSSHVDNNTFCIYAACFTMLALLLQYRNLLIHAVMFCSIHFHTVLG